MSDNYNDDIIDDVEYTTTSENNIIEDEHLTDAISQEAGIVTTVTDMADQSIDRMLDKLEHLGSSEEVQEVLNSLGVGPYLKDVNKDRVKTVLSFLGLWYLKGKFKNKNVALALFGIGGAYLIFKNNDSIIKSISNKIV